MAIPIKKIKSGFAIPEFGIGTFGMGGERERDPQHDDEADIRAIQAALAAGVTHIDTAEVYAQGRAEEIIAQAIKGYERTKLFIVSKVYQTNLAHDDVLRSCEASLRRLETDYLDLYLIHKFNPQVPLAETMKALDELKAQGLIKNIGVSNFCVDHFKEAQNHTDNKIVFNQVHYNLIFREPQRKGVLEYCQDNDILFGAWRPFEQKQVTQELPEVMAAMMAKYKKTAVQIAINWLVSQPNVVILAKSTNLDHLQDNLGGVGWYMDQADVKKLMDKYPDQQGISNRQPLSDEIVKRFYEQTTN